LVILYTYDRQVNAGGLGISGVISVVKGSLFKVGFSGTAFVGGGFIFDVKQ